MHPCWSDASDFTPMGEAEASVEVDSGADVSLVFLVPRPFGPGTDVLLTLHAIRGNGNDGGRITLAVSDEMPRTVIVHPAKPRMDLTLLSGPQRYDEGLSPDDRYDN